MAWRESFWLKCKVRLSGGRPFRHRLRRCHPLPTLSLTRHLSPAGESLSKGTAFSGGDKVSGIAQRRPLGGAGTGAPEGVSTETPPVCCADSPLWDGAFGMAGEFLAKVQSFRERQRLPPLFHMEHFTSPRRRWGCGRCTRCSRPSLPGGRWRARRCRSSAGWRGRWY